MTSTTKQAATTAATSAALALKATLSSSSEANAQAFVASARSHGAALRARVDAKSQAAANKAAGAGYGSVTAVIYHSLTGWVLDLPSGDWGDESAPSPTAMQTLVKSVITPAGGTDRAKAIIRRAKTQAAAVSALRAACAPRSVESFLKEAHARVTKAAEARCAGGAWGEEEGTALASLRSEIDRLLSLVVDAEVAA